MTAENDIRLQALSSLLQVEQEARNAETFSELSFVFVNDSRRVLSCDQVWFWRFDDIGSPRVERVSNVSDVDRNSVQVRWVEKFLKWTQKQDWHTDAMDLSSEDAPDELSKEWDSVLPEQILYLPFVGRDFPGGLLLAGQAPWLEGHKALAEILANAYSHAWRALEKPAKHRVVLKHFRRFWLRYLLFLCLFVFYPARQYVLAPAEVVAETPVVVAAPLSGVVDSFHVDPNETVDKGALLFSFEDSELASQQVMATRAYEVAEAEYLKNAQASLTCDDCRERAGQLKAIMERERAQVAIAQGEYQRSKVYAPVKGVAVFSDKNDWVGKPVRVGEKIMTIADPEKTKMRIELPVEDAIALEAGAEVVFYPNISPLDSYSGVISRTSYEAKVTDDQALAYPLIASFDGEPARLGLRGTVKLYGNRAPVLYLIMRKPFSWVRRTLGL